MWKTIFPQTGVGRWFQDIFILHWLYLYTFIVYLISIIFTLQYIIKSLYNAQTLLKAEKSDHIPAGKKKALTQSLKISTNGWNMSRIPMITHCPIIPVWLECSHFICRLEHSCHSSLKWQIEFVEQVKYVTQVSKFCNSFCVTETCCQWWLFFQKKPLDQL